ncbi:hypothetical protein ACUN0C_18715 [Faunimonas sp. B44]|uniref:hypothetical protein n=1 Tax=Faunimonas sp. B44 TaxID=3461493 RepID=UPI004044AD16
MRTPFAQWMHQVNEACIELAAVSIYDLGDMDYYGLWTEGADPETVARRALKKDGADVYD